MASPIIGGDRGAARDVDSSEAKGDNVDCATLGELEGELEAELLHGDSNGSDVGCQSSHGDVRPSPL